MRITVVALALAACKLSSNDHGQPPELDSGVRALHADAGAAHDGGSCGGSNFLPDGGVVVGNDGGASQDAGVLLDGGHGCPGGGCLDAGMQH